MDFTIKTTIPAKRKKVYKAWLDSEKHSAMTGGEANVSKKVGDTFTAWDGYITGLNLILKRKKLIIQSWRTSEFAEDEESSQVEVNFDKVKDGTEITLIHSNLPNHGMQYKQGWVDNYFTPMKEYFGKN